MNKSNNKNLYKAKTQKNDEFYTQLSDIENELKHYKNHFKGKTVLCNCDLEWSNFVKYFQDNLESLGIKKLLFSGYNKDKNTGDFRSAECIELLKQADIVVTNPPFSLFREYVSQLVEYDKKFIIIGHQNAITYKEIFKLIKENKIWLGYGFRGGAAHFINEHYENYATAGDKKEGMIRVSGVVWFTNLEIKKRQEEMILYKKYTPEEYPHYDNYDAINIDKTKDIPMDWEGAMGVPITFLDKYNPEQFEILGLGRHKIGGRAIYARMLIKNKKPVK